MQSLFLAIISSALVSIVMRLSETRVRNKMGFFMANYLVCTVLALAFTVGGGFAASPFTIGFGAFSGFLYLYSFVLFRQNVKYNGVVMSSTFMKLGVLIPTLMAIVVFRESPRLPQIAGILLAVAAILLLHMEKGEKTEGKWLLLALLAVSGFTDGTANIFDKVGDPAGKDFFLVCIFFTAFLCSGILALRSKAKIGIWDVVFGGAIGIPNYFSSRFLLAALRTVPAVVTYPVFSVGTILVVTVVGVAAFQERLDKRKTASVALILTALVLLNL